MAPDLAQYDWVVLNSSAGKDSQAMLDVVVEHAVRAAVKQRLVVVHADLGRMEWAGVRELAEEHARHYGLRFEVVKRAQGDLLSHVRRRGRWPSSQQRYCTSDHKRNQVYTLLTRLTAELSHLGRQIRILQCLGLRADESPARAKKAAFKHDTAASNGRRQVDLWLPIHSWREQQVWWRILQAGTRVHPAYDQGMPRLSCCFCVLASRDALRTAARLNPELLQEYLQVEVEIGHRFRPDISLAELVSRGKERF